MRGRVRGWVAVMLGGALLAPVGTRTAMAQTKTPVVLDTDIGGDIDDAFAVAMVLASHDLQLKAVTTVSGDTMARARVAAKMLAVGGVTGVPVAAGEAQKGDPPIQAKWAEGFEGGGLTKRPAIEVMKAAIDAEQGKAVLIALGPLTNVAALLQQFPEERRKIREIVLMGGAVRHGYRPGSAAEPEYNIAADAPAAQAVFGAGVPIRMAPLDVTAATQLGAEDRTKIFARHTPMTEALEALYKLWGQETPTLHDPMAISLLTAPQLTKTESLHITVDGKGMTLMMPGKPNAVVAVETDPQRFVAYYTALVTR